MEMGDVPSVMAVSFGAGDPKRDSVMVAFLDADGYLREHTKLDSLAINPNKPGAEDRAIFGELLRRRRPNVVIIGGFSPNTRELMQDVRAIAQEQSALIVEEMKEAPDDENLTEEEMTRRAAFDCIYIYDDVARIYQNSKRASIEFPELSTLGKYCVALARYAQNPLLEYIALGPDLTAISVHLAQKFVSVSPSHLLALD